MVTDHKSKGQPSPSCATAATEIKGAHFGAKHTMPQVAMFFGEIIGMIPEEKQTPPLGGNSQGGNDEVEWSTVNPRLKIMRSHNNKEPIAPSQEITVYDRRDTMIIEGDNKGCEAHFKVEHNNAIEAESAVQRRGRKLRGAVMKFAVDHGVLEFRHRPGADNPANIGTKCLERLQSHHEARMCGMRYEGDKDFPKGAFLEKREELTKAMESIVELIGGDEKENSPPSGGSHQGDVGLTKTAEGQVHRAEETAEECPMYDVFAMDIGDSPVPSPAKKRGYKEATNTFQTVRRPGVLGSPWKESSESLRTMTHRSTLRMGSLS